MWYRFDVSRKIVVIFIIQSGLKLHVFTIVAVRVETHITKRSDEYSVQRPCTECGKTTMNRTGKKAIQLILQKLHQFCSI